MSPVKEWWVHLSVRFKFATSMLGFIAMILTIMFTWRNLELPEFVFTPAMAAVEEKIDGLGVRLEERFDDLRKLNLDTRALLLHDKWVRAIEKLEKYQRDLLMDPINEAYIALEFNQRNHVRNIEKQLNDLEKIGQEARIRNP